MLAYSLFPLAPVPKAYKFHEPEAEPTPREMDCVLVTLLNWVKETPKLVERKMPTSVLMYSSPAMVGWATISRTDLADPKAPETAVKVAPVSTLR